MAMMKRSLSCPTPECSKPPNSSPDRTEDTVSFTSGFSLEKALCALKLKDEEVLALKEELAEQENRNQELELLLQQEELSYNDLNSKFSNKSQENDANVERIIWLETENDRLVVDIEELQKQQRWLQNSSSENIKALKEKVASKESIIQDMGWSKSNLEKEVARLMTENKKYLDSEQKGKKLQAEVKRLELSRIELEKEAGLAHQLSIGNLELEKQVAQAEERVVEAETHISRLIRDIEALEQQNLTLREEKEDLSMSLESSRAEKILAKPTFEDRTSKLTVETSHSEVLLTPLDTGSTVSPTCLAAMFDQIGSTSDDRLKGLISLNRICEAKTPSQYMSKVTPQENKATNLSNEYIWKESPKSGESGYVKKVDVLEEYLYLSASAVKIKYPTVEITNDELLHEARKIPYHELYDFLRARMELKLKEQETQITNDSDKKKHKSKFRRLLSWSPLKKRKDSTIKTIPAIL